MTLQDDLIYSHRRHVKNSKFYAHIAQEEEHIIGNDEVTGSNPVVGSEKLDLMGVDEHERADCICV